MKKLTSTNPYTGKVISEVAEWSEEQVAMAVEASEKAFLQYRNTGFKERKDRMLRVAALLRDGKEEHAGVITAEMGKLKREAIAEVEKCAWVCEYYAEHAEAFLQPQDITSDARYSGTVYQPLGPLLAIMPWNFPFWQVYRFAAPNLMAGNTILLKHASNVQGCAAIIERLFREAGFEESVFTNLPISSSRVEKVIADQRVRGVTLTGSESAGRAVAASAGKYLKKSVLELGGNNAFVVLDDADLLLAVEQAMTGRLLNAGQSCIAAKRFIIQSGIYDAFLQQLSKRVKKLRHGDPFDLDTSLAPLFSTIQADEIERQVQDALDKGAKLVMGGEKNEAFFEVTILTGVGPGMQVFDNETFGPVFAISKVDTVEEALALSNTSDFGLGMQVFTGSSATAGYFIEQANEGAVFVNGFVKSDPRLPFGGVKNSGYGRELAKEGILEFVNCKTVWSNL